MIAARHVLHSALARYRAYNGDGTACSICHDNVVVGDTGVRLDCGHEFHCECIGGWSIEKPSCPDCREPFSVYELWVAAVAEAIDTDDQYRAVIDKYGGGGVVEAQDAAGATALMLAVMAGNLPCARALLERGAQVNAAAPDDTEDERGVGVGRTALMLASLHGQPKAIRLLRENNANLRMKDEEDFTALMLICNNDKGASNEEKALCVPELIAAAGVGVDEMDEGHWTALLMAAQNNNAPCVAALLKADANVNHADLAGETALMLASDGPDETARMLESDGGGADDATACVKHLLEYGADVDRVDAAGDTALIRASFHGCDAIVRMLLGSGASAEKRNQAGHTALNAAQVGKAGVQMVLNLARVSEGDVQMAPNLAQVYIKGLNECIRLLSERSNRRGAPPKKRSLNDY